MRGTKASKENSGNNDNTHYQYYLQKDKQKYSPRRHLVATKIFKNVSVRLWVGNLNNYKEFLKIKNITARLKKLENRVKQSREKRT